MLWWEIYGWYWQMVFSVLLLFVQCLYQFLLCILFLVGSLVSLLLVVLVNVSVFGCLCWCWEVVIQVWLVVIVGNLVDGIIGVGFDGVISDWNCGVEVLFGYCEEQVVGWWVVDLLVLLFKENEEFDIFVCIVCKEQVVSFDIVCWYQDGYLFDVVVIVLLIFGLDGGVVGVLKIVCDIFVKKVVEVCICEFNIGLEYQIVECIVELCWLNVLFGSVLQVVFEVLIIIFDCDGIISGFNFGVEWMFGYCVDEVVGKVLLILLYSEWELFVCGQELGEEGFCVLVVWVEQEGVEICEWIYLCKDGLLFSVMFLVIVLCDEVGVINGYLGIVVDVIEWCNVECEMVVVCDQL